MLKSPLEWALVRLGLEWVQRMSGRLQFALTDTMDITRTLALLMATMDLTTSSAVSSSVLGPGSMATMGTVSMAEGRLSTAGAGTVAQADSEVLLPSRSAVVLHSMALPRFAVMADSMEAAGSAVVQFAAVEVSMAAEASTGAEVSMVAIDNG